MDGALGEPAPALGGAPAAAPEQAARPEVRRGLSLFWRTFVLLALLLSVSILTWLQTFRSQELEPRAVQTAAQITSLVNLSRAALIHSDGIARISLIKTLAEQEGVRIIPREPTDRYEVFATDTISARMSREIAERLGSGSVVADRVNGVAGLWVGFLIDGDAYWLLTDPARVGLGGGRTWLIWLGFAAVLSLAGAALIAGLINRPLDQLTRAIGRLREGRFESAQLDEHTLINEIRDVNIGFNRMVDQLGKVEQDRNVMLAGISHDLRTPLARLRLETELSVADADTREHMAADIAQVDAVIGKFLDYARPGQTRAAPVPVQAVLDAALYALQDQPGVRIDCSVTPGLTALADEVELLRVLGNLLENARRYGRDPVTGLTHVDILARAAGKVVAISVRDHGPGVAPELLGNLTKPFYRGDSARSEASGTGLGLAIVDKSMRRMGGSVALSNASGGGLQIELRLPLAPAASRKAAERGVPPAA